MADRTFINDLQPNRRIDGIFSIQNGQLGLTKSGKPYLRCLLADRTGRTPGRMWNATEELFKTLPSDGFVWIEGQTQPYQGQMQVVIDQIRAVQPTPEDLFDLLPRTAHDVGEMFSQLQALLDTVKHPQVKALVGAYLADEALMERFKQAPAAMTLHHAFLGGLLEHTLSLVRLGDAFSGLYPRLNRDILLVGLFIHDIGKCQELSWGCGFDYEDRGRLVGHIALGLLELQRKAAACAESGQAIGDDLLMVIQHIVLSHHGRPEHGAAMFPATPEAIAAALLDNLDAKVQMAIEAARPEESGNASGEGEDSLRGNFTEKMWALETRLYKPDPAAE